MSTAAATASETSYVKLFKLADGTVLLWNKKDIVAVRRDYHIVGKLVGCYPGAPRQNQVLTAPLLLTPEEATLLIEKVIMRGETKTNSARWNISRLADPFLEFAKLYQGGLDEAESAARKEEADRYYSKSLEEQRLLALEAKKSEVISKKELIFKGMCKKTGRPCLTPAEKQEALDKILAEIRPIGAENMLIHMPSECAWTRPLNEAQWLYPETTSQRLRYLVFRDLWTKEFYITCGAKFGGDFLVYPGDPDLYHAQYIAVCRIHQDQMENTDMVQMARLASNVKKTVLICTARLDTKVVSYCKLNYNPTRHSKPE